MAECQVHFRKLSWFERHSPAILTAIALAGIIALAALLRFWQLGIRTFTDDESLYSLMANGLARGHGYEHVPELHGPMQVLLTAGVFRAFGDSDLTARAMPAVFGVMLAALPFAFARHIGRPGAIAASLLLAVSPTMLYFSRYAGPDIYLAFFSLTTAIVLWRYLAEPNRAWLYLLSLTLAAMAITTEMALLVAPIFALYLHYRLAGEFWSQAQEPAIDANAPRTHYDLLGVTPQSPVSAVRRAYKEAIDRAGTPSEREAMANAYHVLTTPNRREAYDRKIARRALIASDASVASTPGIGTQATIAATAGLIAIAWPLAGALRRRLNIKALPESAGAASGDALVVMTLLMLPFYGPLVQKLWLVGDRGFVGQRTIVVLGGTNIVPGGEQTIMYWTLGILFAATMILGLLWKWHAWVICWAAFYGVALTAFTGLFSQRGGVWSGIWGTLDYTWRPETRHADAPAFYYGMTMPVYEFLPLAACAAGLLAMLIRGGWRDRAITVTAAIAIAALVAAPASPIGDSYRLPAAAIVACGGILLLRMPELTKFLAFWTVGAFFAFSMVGLKQPWLMVHVALPSIMLAGALFNDAIAAFELPAVTVPQFRPYAPRRLAQGMVAAAFAALAVFTLRSGVLASWGHGDVPQLAHSLAPRDHGDTPIELLTPATNAPDVREVSLAIAQAAAASPQGDNVTIVLDASHDFASGWGWYLRDYPNLTFADMRKPYDAPAGAIVLADARNRFNVRSAETALTLTFTRRWAFPGDYMSMTKDDVTSQLASADAWSSWYGYLRDRTEIGRPSYLEGVAFFPQELSAAVRLPRQSDVLSAAVTPVAVPPADPQIATDAGR